MRLIIFLSLLISSNTFAQKLKLDDPLPKNLFIELAKNINPSIVNISVSSRPRMMSSGDPFFDLFQQFGMNGNIPMAPQPMQGAGSGFIIEKEGLIITNNHVIDGADDIRVQLSEKDKKTYPAKVIGKDKITDIALLKIETTAPLPILELGSSEKTEVGEWVAAFGNPYGHGHTITKGIISAKNREIDELNAFPFLQTDASINPGNSGGPLVNSEGKVIGVNSAIDARAQGIGFAIPIDYVKSLIPQLKANGKITRGYLGLQIDNLNPRAARMLRLESTDGVLITNIFAGSPADIAGLREYDVITEFGEKEITNAQSLVNSISTTPIGNHASVTYIRNGKTLKTKVTIAEGPDKRALTKRPPTASPKGVSNDLGMRVTDLTPELAKEFHLGFQKAPVITEVLTGSLAENAGLASGDIILDINRKPIKSAAEVAPTIQKDTNVIRVKRGDIILVVFVSNQ